VALSRAGPKRAAPYRARGDEGTTTRPNTRVDHLRRLRGAAAPARGQGLTFTQTAHRCQRGRACARVGTTTANSDSREGV
jgi:hypothetical protein